MMPKTILIAPAGVSGQIHASHSGKNYDISPDGTVVVDHVDVAALVNGGFQHLPPTREHRERSLEAAPISSVATLSHEVGATAIDPAKREAFHRPLADGPEVQPNHDHGDATPPHGMPDEGVSTDATRADAQEEIDTAERAGLDPTQRSHVANTGHMGVSAATGADQAEVRGENDVKETDEEREAREERERMPPAPAPEHQQA